MVPRLGISRPVTAGVAVALRMGLRRTTGALTPTCWRSDSARHVTACRRGGHAAASRVRTEPGARAPAPDAHAGARESDPKPAAAGAGLRGGGIGDDRRVGGCRHRLRDRARNGEHRLRARVPARRRRRRPCRRACEREPACFATGTPSMCRSKRSCQAMWCCCRPAAWFPRTA